MARNLFSPGTAAFAFAWLVARACVQSITIDEADTYLAYVGPRSPTHWSGAANNQILNSLLMRLSTSVFGVSHLTVRMPALVGAAIYICAAYFVVSALTTLLSLQWPLFVCLVYNPFVMDHLVAARGYSLALGLWMAAIAIALHRGPLALASLCAGLSFSANFSFAFVNAVTMGLICVRHGRRTILQCTLPGLMAAAFLTGSVLAGWPKNQLVYGAHSVAETFAGILTCSRYELNPYLVNPPLREFLEHYSKLLFPALGAAFLTRLPVLRRKNLATAAVIIIALTVGTHWLLFRFAHVLLPKERSAIYLAPLLFLTAGAAAAIPGGRVSRLAIAGMLAVFAGYFVLCLRLTYFREWKWNADTKEIHYVLSYYNRKYGLNRVMTNWRYVAALNFYRDIPGYDTDPEIQSQLPPYPDDRMAYVLYFPSEEAFIKDHRLKIVYYGSLSETAVAIRPELESPPAAAVSCNGARPDPRSGPYN